jgi:phosphoribosylformylglycinamidine (FGAM) synthase-like enzyme
VSRSRESGISAKGCDIELAKVPLQKPMRDDSVLYSESQGRLLVTVAPGNSRDFEECMQGCAFGRLGVVTESEEVTIRGGAADSIIRTSIRRLLDSYKGVFKDF